jgi:hypothetical protein
VINHYEALPGKRKGNGAKLVDFRATFIVKSDKAVAKKLKHIPKEDIERGEDLEIYFRQDFNLPTLK